MTDLFAMLEEEYRPTKLTGTKARVVAVNAAGRLLAVETQTEARNLPPDQVASIAEIWEPLDDEIVMVEVTNFDTGTVERWTPTAFRARLRNGEEA